jgi:hypothetical protein
MPPLTRRRLLVAAPLVVLLLVAGTVLLFGRGGNLKSRSARISVGMPREQVEGILGRPARELKRADGTGGGALVWVDQFWQVDVVTDREGRAEFVGCVPSDSLYRRTVGRLTSFSD